MGCDIHFWVEKKVDDTWSKCEDKILVDCASCEATGIREKKPAELGENPESTRKCYWCSGTGKQDALDYTGRNYAFFSILADVRNGKVGEDDYLEPISEERGMPRDSGLYYWYEKDIDCHSESHHTLKQLKDFDWNKKSKKNARHGDVSTYGELCGYFYYYTIPALEKLSYIYGGDENVRIVFYFDN